MPILLYYITRTTSRPAYRFTDFDLNVKNANGCLCAIVMSLSNRFRWFGFDVIRQIALKFIMWLILTIVLYSGQWDCESDRLWVRFPFLFSCAALISATQHEIPPVFQNSLDSVGQKCLNGIGVFTVKGNFPGSLCRYVRNVFLTVRCSRYS